MRKIGWLALAVLVVATLACESSGGSAVSSRETCRTSGSTTTCEGNLAGLSGTYTKEVEDEEIDADEAIPFEITFSVESGTVRVSVEAPDGTVKSAEATPGSPATLSATATGDTFDELFEIIFEAVDGEASGVSYTMAYQIP